MLQQKLDTTGDQKPAQNNCGAMELQHWLYFKKRGSPQEPHYAGDANFDKQPEMGRMKLSCGGKHKVANYCDRVQDDYIYKTVKQQKP